MQTEEIKKVLVELSKVCILGVEVLKERKGQNEMYFMSGTKNSGALRRASMDLTRALACMRNR